MEHRWCLSWRKKSIYRPNYRFPKQNISSSTFPLQWLNTQLSIDRCLEHNGLVSDMQKTASCFFVWPAHWDIAKNAAIACAAPAVGLVVTLRSRPGMDDFAHCPLPIHWNLPHCWTPPWHGQRLEQATGSPYLNCVMPTDESWRDSPLFQKKKNTSTA